MEIRHLFLLYLLLLDRFRLNLYMENGLLNGWLILLILLNPLLLLDGLVHSVHRRRKRGEIRPVLLALRRLLQLKLVFLRHLERKITESLRTFGGIIIMFSTDY